MKISVASAGGGTVANRKTSLSLSFLLALSSLTLAPGSVKAGDVVDCSGLESNAINYKACLDAQAAAQANAQAAAQAAATPPVDEAAGLAADDETVHCHGPKGHPIDTTACLAAIAEAIRADDKAKDAEQHTLLIRLVPDALPLSEAEFAAIAATRAAHSAALAAAGCPADTIIPYLPDKEFDRCFSVSVTARISTDERQASIDAHLQATHCPIDDVSALVKMSDKQYLHCYLASTGSDKADPAYSAANDVRDENDWDSKVARCRRTVGCVVTEGRFEAY